MDATLKVARKGSNRDKKNSQILGFYAVFLEQNRRNATKKFERIFVNLAWLCLATDFLEVGARVSLKVTTKVSIRDKKGSEKLDFEVVFLKQKRWSAT